MQIGFAKRACVGQFVCGDAVHAWHIQHHIWLALADGVGHGEEAAAAANAAIEHLVALTTDQHEDGVALLELLNEKLRNSRGVVIAIAKINTLTSELQFYSVGNISGLLISTKNKSRLLPSCNGIVGDGFETLLPQQYRLNEGDILVLCSDGINNHINLKPRIELFFSTIFNAPLASNILSFSMYNLAEELLEHFAVENDDASLLIYRHQVT